MFVLAGALPFAAIVVGRIASIVLALTMLSAALQAQGSNEVLLASAQTDGKGATQAIAIPVGAPRVRGVRLAIKGGSVNLDRIVITYANGQVHYESRPITLSSGGADARTRLINPREPGESQQVESVELHFAGGAAPARSATIEVLGWRAAQTASAPWPPATMPTLPPGVRPRGEDNDSPSQPSMSTSPDGRYVEVPVFFSTTRQREKDRTINGRQAASFSGVPGGGEPVLGRAVVTVPIDRKRGTLPTARTVPLINWKLFRDDPSQHFLIATVDVLPRASFVSEMRKSVGASSTFKGQALVFVHGYKVNFDDAMLRTAQVAHDMGFDGPAVAYSWPAGGRLFDYHKDADAARTSFPGLRALLEKIASETGATSVNLIAHSMGNQPLLEMLSRHVERGGKREVDLKLNEVVFAAPDVDVNHFRQSAAGLAAVVTGGLTLYASRNDIALKASKSLFSRLARAGDVPSGGPVVVTGVESIDVSETTTSFFELNLNHSHFADRPHLLADMKLMFERTTNKHPPHVRFPVYQEKGTQQRRWWEYLR